MFLTVSAGLGLVIAQNSSLTTHELERKAKDKDAGAQLELGMRYLKGDQAIQDLKEAEKWLKKAADQNNAEALYQLGMFYFKGIGKEKPDYKKAFKTFSKAAEMNYPKALFMVGECYLYGYGEKENPVKGMDYIRAAAREGLPTAELFYGYCLETGNGVSKNPTEALEMYAAAAKSGLPEAAYKLGVAYEEGLGVKRNPQEAEKWFGIAARNESEDTRELPRDEATTLKAWTSIVDNDARSGSAMALNQLGNLYYFGIVKDRNERDGISWFEKAADKGLVEAQAKLGNYFYTGKLSLNTDDMHGFTMDTIGNPEALKWWKKAAMSGDLDSKIMTALNNFINGIDNDVRENFLYILEGAEAGNPVAQFYTGMCYFHGIGTTENESEAFRWIKLAAQNDYFPAQSILGQMYLYGIGTHQNENEGLKWLATASSRGSAEASQILANHYLENKQYDIALEYAATFEKQTGYEVMPMLKLQIGTSYFIDRDYTEAYEWLKQSSDAGVVDASFLVGYCRYAGLGTNTSYKEAVNIWQQCAEEDNTPSLYYLGLCYDLGRGVAKDRNRAIDYYRRAARSDEFAASDTTEFAIVEEYDFYADSIPAYEEIEVEEIEPYYDDDIFAADSVAAYYDDDEYAYEAATIDSVGSPSMNPLLTYLNLEDAQNGDMIAQYTMGNLYYYGIGGYPDFEEARYWYMESAKQGFEPAKLMLQQMGVLLGQDYERGPNQNILLQFNPLALFSFVDYRINTFFPLII